MNVKDSLHYALQQRAYGLVTSDVLSRRARDNKYFIQCLERSGTLTGHDGCVNSISWNESGELLLSGSDDCRVNIYRPFQKKLLQSIRTGHRANIFSAKFLPCSADKKIVSCSGDGVLQYTDIERPESFGKFSYNCHSGTAYEVITTPGDPNTFISCGEDGTVRMFDIRTKSKCAKRDCKDDILIDSGKAVTSISINPLAPYQLGIGCEDSLVALFDRRSLSTASASSGRNGMKGMTYKFKPDTLRDRTCRVTSLQYSGDGSELLVSYCADYVYLFDTKGQKEVRCNSEVAQDNGSIAANNTKDNTPMKRLRLRGDWSDTGPNARPESEGASTESTLMQRMSDLFVRWIEESFRGSQRSRLRSAQARTSPSTSSSASFLSRSTNSSSSDSSGILEASGSIPSRDRETGTDGYSDEMEESESTSTSLITVRERSVEDMMDERECPEDPSPLDCPGESPSESPSESLLGCSGNSGLKHPSRSTLEFTRESPLECSKESSSKSSELYRESPLCLPEEDKMSSLKTAAFSELVNDKKLMESSQVNESKHFNNQNDKMEVQSENSQCTPSITLSTSDTDSYNKHSEQFEMEQGGAYARGRLHDQVKPTEEIKDCNARQGVAGSRCERERTTASGQENSYEQFSVDYPQEGLPSLRSRSKRTISSRKVQNKQTNMDHQQGVADTRGEPVEDCSSCPIENKKLISAERHEEGVASTRGDPVEDGSSCPIENKKLISAERHQEGVAGTRGEPVEDVSSCPVTNNKQNGTECQQDGVVGSRGEVPPTSSSRDTASDSSQSEAATRIQRMFRNYKEAKNNKTIADCDYFTDWKDDFIWVPKMTRVYRGHRNARTMIKEARFWGDRYIISGSDCGRIFLWDKDTTEVVMVFQGDRHVVNCVQPHPFDPVLASSGIDYDIKLWTPTASQPVQVQGLEEIVRTNEQMLEESRDTITVPASFMLRMLASLNHARLGRTQDDSETDSNESD